VEEKGDAKIHHFDPILKETEEISLPFMNFLSLLLVETIIRSHTC
jgi:hypothetical protein